MENIYAKHLAGIREEMREEGIDIYLIPHSDEHNSEYVGDADHDIAFACGFTGENTTVVITKDESRVWADGRYFLQAEHEIEGSGTDLMKMGVDGVPTVNEYLKSVAFDGAVFAYNGRKVTLSLAREYEKALKGKGVTIRPDFDLVSRLWADRPAKSCQPVWVLEDRFSGVSVDEKISAIREHMKEEGADGFLLSNLTDIAWLMNLRGNDIECTPVFYSYVWITQDVAILYVQLKELDPEVEKYLSDHHIIVKPYNEIYSNLGSFTAKIVAVDPEIVNAELIEKLGADVTLIEEPNVTERMKAVKNPVEVENTKKAHVIDAVAMCKFIYQLKTGVIDVENEDEYSVAEILYSLREQGEDYIEPSFGTIAAYGPNAAMMHYAPTKEKKSPLHREGFLLVDSGGTYKWGTTDITRTIVLGPISDQQKRDFTLVLKAAMRLKMAKFPGGTTAQILDVLSRGIMWDYGLDYRCGTGHGVGHILSVHEGPNAFRPKINSMSAVFPLTAGVITTDEPGLYYDGEYGIRTENELLCVEDEKTEYGQFYHFENITLVPIDLDGIDVSMLTEDERKELNTYHARVYETIAPKLTANEAKWLKEATKAI